MEKRLETEAYRQLRDEITPLLREGEQVPSLTQLEHWRADSYIPTTDPVGDRTTRYPPGTAKQVVALMRALDKHHRLSKAALELFFEGYEIGAPAMRSAITHELEYARRGLEKTAGTWRGRSGGPAPPLKTAAALAHKMMQRQLPRASAAERRRMLERLERPARWVSAVETAAERLESALTGTWYVFLRGEWLPQSESVVYQAFVAFGGEDLAAFLKGTFGVELPVVFEALAEQLRRISLPRIKETLEKMTTADFVAARTDYLAIVDVGLYFVDAIRALLPTQPRLSKPLRVEIGRIAPLLMLPALYDVRRRYRERIEAIVAIGRDLVPEWRATLDEAHASGALASAGQRAQALSDTREAMQTTES